MLHAEQLHRLVKGFKSLVVFAGDVQVSTLVPELSDLDLTETRDRRTLDKRFVDGRHILGTVIRKDGGTDNGE